jgi:hypothetical protein
MTFGNIKSIIEKNLLDSYKNESEFKKTLKEFKHNVLNNKPMSKVFSVYDQLSKPQGLNESDAKEFLEEGISLIQKMLHSIKLPKTLQESIENNYSDIDTLVYDKKIDLKERIEAKKRIVSLLSQSKSNLKETINIPFNSMVSIANQTLRNYIETMDESSKKEFLELVSEDSKVLESKFEILKESAIEKLEGILQKEDEEEIKSKITETIDRLKSEKFNQVTFLKLKNLESSL